MKKRTLLVSYLLCGCGGLACPEPPDGLLLEGDWGGEEWSLTVRPDGTTWVESACAGGESDGPVYVEDGRIDFTASLMVQTSAPSGEAIPATFSGKICADTLHGKVEIGGERGAFTALWGEPSRVGRCEVVSAPLP